VKIDNPGYVEFVVARFLAAQGGFEGTWDELDARAKTTPFPEDAKDLIDLMMSADE